jgi:hypothetical protein
MEEQKEKRFCGSQFLVSTEFSSSKIQAAKAVQTRNGQADHFENLVIESANRQIIRSEALFVKRA